MFLLTIGSAIMYMFANDAFEVAEKNLQAFIIVIQLILVWVVSLL